MDKPSTLNDVGAAHWDEVIAKCIAVGKVLSDTDYLVIEQLAMSYTIIRLADDDIQEFGIAFESNGERKKNPSCATLNSATTNYRNYLGELQITSRTNKKEVKVETKSPLEAFLSIAPSTDKVTKETKKESRTKK